MSHKNQRDGTYGFSSLSEKTRKSNRLQMSLQRQHFLFSYLKTLSVGPARVRTRDLPLSRPALSQGGGMTRRSSMQSSRRAIFSFLIFFLAYSHCKLQNFLVFVRVVSLFGPFFRAGEKTYFLSYFHPFCVLKMFVHPDGASTTVPVT